MIVNHRAQMCDTKSNAITGDLQHRIVAFGIVAESKVIADNHVLYAEDAHEKLIDDGVCRSRAGPFVKRNAQHVVQVEIAQNRNLLTESSEPRRHRCAAEILTRLRFKRHQHALAVQFLRFSGEMRQQHLMAMMYAVERADRDNTISMSFTHVVQPANEFQPNPYTRWTRCRGRTPQIVKTAPYTTMPQITMMPI